MALAEAMSLGLACISFDCPCGPLDIIEDGKNGFIIKSFDCEDFAKKITNLMKNESVREQVGKRAAISVKKKLSIDVIMKQWIDLFDSLMK